MESGPTRQEHAAATADDGARRDDGAEGPPTGSADDVWKSFLEPEGRAQYLEAWLAIACYKMPDAAGAILFVCAEAGRLGVGASWRITSIENDGFQRIATDVASRAEAVVHPSLKGVLLGYPIKIAGAVQAVIVLHLSRHPGKNLRDVFRQLHWDCGWIEAQLWHGRSAISAKQVEAARLTLELLAAADSHDRFEASAMAVVNALTGLTDFDRAALGMNRRQKVRLEALSRVAAFKKRSEFVAEFETAMEEAVAQDLPIALPKAKGGPSVVDLAHRALIQRTGDGIALTVPMQVRGRSIGAVTVTRRRGDNEVLELDPDAIEQLRLAVASVAPVLKLKHDERRWLSGRARHVAGRAATAVLGRRPAVALGFVAAVVLLVLPFVLSGEFKVSAKAALQGSQQQAAVALLDGFILESGVRAGEFVDKGSVLAVLDDRDLKLERSKLDAGIAKAEQTTRDALATGDRVASARASADLAEAKASLDLLTKQFERLNVTAPVDGIVVSGDLSQRLGAPVSRGEVLFEIARLDSYRVIMDVSEYDLAHVKADQTGALVLASLFDQAIPFRVIGIARISDPADGENRFRVEANVTAPATGMRPGMEGVAKIDAGRARLAWIWTRGTIGRLRMFFWRFLP